MSTSVEQVARLLALVPYLQAHPNADLVTTAAAFGVARLVFQDGWGSSFMGFEHQGFLDAWAPVFFFATSPPYVTRLSPV